jgi:tyrosyl-tRNA synthetase
LAEDVTRRVHSEADLLQAQKASSLLFGKAVMEDFETTSAAVLAEVFDGIPQKTYTQAEFAEVGSLVDLLSQTLETSKSDIRKLIKNNGLSVNQAKISPELGEAPTNFKLIQNKYLLIKKGKNFYLVNVIHN